MQFGGRCKSDENFLAGGQWGRFSGLFVLGDVMKSKTNLVWDGKP